MKDIREFSRLAKINRELLDKAGNKKERSYKSGFDIGYHLGYAQAMEFVVRDSTARAKILHNKPNENK